MGSEMGIGIKQFRNKETRNMTLDEVDQSLPNGFHDSSILGLRIDYVQRTAKIDMELCFSDPDEAPQEKYRPATLFISELLYFVIEPQRVHPAIILRVRGFRRWWHIEFRLIYSHIQFYFSERSR